MSATAAGQRELARLPLRQTWRTPNEPSATRPGSIPRKPGRYEVSVGLQGGEICALNETFLREARHAVQAVHAAALSFEHPVVHIYVDPELDSVMEPVMLVRVNADRLHMRTLADELRARGARMHEVELQQDAVVIRAEARLASILGLENSVAAATMRSGQVFSWFIRYDRVTPTMHEVSCTGGD